MRCKAHEGLLITLILTLTINKRKLWKTGKTFIDAPPFGPPKGDACLSKNCSALVRAIDLLRTRKKKILNDWTACRLMLWRPFFLGYEHPDKNTHSNHHPILGRSIIQNKKVLWKKSSTSGEKRGWKPHPRPLPEREGRKGL